jgi:hypothetical protein
MLRAAVLFAAVGLSLASVAAAAAEAEMRGDQLVVQPRLSWPAYQLRVVAPGGATHEAMFLRGEEISVSSRQIRGGWVDGTYSYEIIPVRGMAERPERQAGGPGYSKSAAISESGSFRIQGGRVFARADVAEPGAQGLAGPSGIEALQLVAEDLAVQGSLCVGFDCTSTESFGFDTLRFKENNTRIKFDDTSVSAGFPANDWQLTANDSASGGLNKFSIDDVTGAKVPFTVLAGAPTNSFFMDATGRIGLRTATPALDVHINTGNTPAIRMEQNSSGGWGTQTWDIGANEANFFVRDLTSGSRLPFRIRPGAPTSSIDIGATGNVGIGTSAPGASLDIARGGDVVVRLSNTTTDGFWDITNNDASGRLTFSDDANGVRTPVKFVPGAANNLLRVGALASDTVDINGNLVVTGSITPDYVFAKDFDLPSIEAHAERMWALSHLPKVSPASVNGDGKGVINVGERSQGMLEELEYAHIYIEQLHSTVQGLQQDMAGKNAELQQLRQEIAAIKAALLK